MDKAEEKILKKYYPVEGSNVYKRLNNRTRNACISKAAQLHLQYGLPMYKGPVLDEWIILAVKQGITKVRQSMTYSEITFKPGKLPELHLRLECDETGKFRVYEKSVLLDEKEYTFEELKCLRYVRQDYIELYNRLNIKRVDDKLIVIRQLLKRDLLPSNMTEEQLAALAGALSVKPLSLWMEKEFANILELKARDAVRVLLVYDK